MLNFLLNTPVLFYAGIALAIFSAFMMQSNNKNPSKIKSKLSVFLAAGAGIMIAIPAFLAHHLIILFNG